MEPDIAFVIGIVLAVLCVPSILSAVSDGRSPRVSAIAVLIAGGLIVYAVQSHPGGYNFADVPHVFTRVVAQIMP